MNNFLITEEEKNSILNLHRLRSKNQYLIFESDEEVDVENFVPKTRAEVMALHQAILEVEKEESKIKERFLLVRSILYILKYQYFLFY